MLTFRQKNLLILLNNKFENVVFECLPYKSEKIILILVKFKLNEIGGDMDFLCVYDKPPDEFPDRKVLRKEIQRLSLLRLSKWGKDIFTKKNRDFELVGKEYKDEIDKYVKRKYPKYYRDWVRYFKKPTFPNYCKVLPLFLQNPDIHSDLRRELNSISIGNCLIMHPKVSPNRVILLVAIFLAQRGFLKREVVYKYWERAMPQKFKKNLDLCNYVIDHFIYPLSSRALKRYVERASIIKKDKREILINETDNEAEDPFSQYAFQRFDLYAESDDDNEDFKQTGYTRVDLEGPPEPTLKRLAKRLGTTPTTLQKLQRAGKLKTEWNPPKMPKSCHGASKTINEKDEETKKTLRKLDEKKKRKKLTLRYAKLKGIPFRSAQVWMSRQIRGKGKTLEEIKKEIKKGVK